MESSDIYKAIDDADVPCLNVKILLPSWYQPLLNAKQFIKVAPPHIELIKRHSVPAHQKATKWFLYDS